MTNRKTTKRAFLASVMALIICFSMLLGTTYAWFTDTVVAGRNRIVSGNLDVELDYAVMENGQIKEWLPVDESTNLFNEDALYEPGYTEVVKFRVRNVGTLAVKCNLGINVVNETAGVNVYGDEFMLSDYLTTGVVDTSALTSADRDDYLANMATTTFADAKNAVYASDLVLLPNDYKVGQGDDEEIFEVVVTMPTYVGNEANFLTDLTGNISTEGIEGFTNQPEIIFGLKLAATQWTYEADDFDNKYDEDAEYPVYTYDELKADLEAGGTTILTENVEVTAPINLATGSVVDGNGHVIYSTIPNANIGTNSERSQFAIVATEGTIKNLAIVGTGRGVGTHGALTGDLTLENYYAAGGSYYFNIGNGNGHKFTVKNSTLVGWGSFGGDYDKVLFENCTFKPAEYHTLRAYDSVTFTNCEFNAGYDFDVQENIGWEKFTFVDCTYNGIPLTSKEQAVELGFISAEDANTAVTKYNWTFTITTP
jgi:predicted ribosomally synthesized peptide with SipW-like signal peptide